AGIGGAVLVQLGNGDGTFKAPVNYKVGTSGASVVVGDLNGDGKPDLVAIAEPFVRGASNQVLPGSIGVLIGNGDGTFQPIVKYVVAKSLLYVTIGDFNRDGVADLVVASASVTSGIVTVLLGNGDGTFRNALTYGAGSAPASLAVGDLN